MKVKTMQLWLLAATITSAPALSVGQGSIPVPNQPGVSPSANPEGTGMAGAMTSSSGTSAGDDQAMRDKMFLRKAAAGGLAEILLGQLAAQKGGSDEVKAFGQKMVTDHTQLNEEMKPIAASLGVPLPNKVKKEDQAEYDKLSTLAGEDFNKEYLAYMVKDHHMDLREFREEHTGVQDTALKAAVEKGYRVIRQHTTMVEKLARDKGAASPSRSAPPSN